MQQPFRLLCLSVLLFLTDSAPANDTAPGDGIIEIAAGVLDNTVNDTIDMPSTGDVAATGLIDMPSTGNVSATGLIDKPSTGDVAATGLIDKLPTGDVAAAGLIDVLSSGDAAAIGLIDMLSSVDEAPTGLIDKPSTGDVAATGLIDMPSTVDVAATGLIDMPSTGDVAATGLIDMPSTGDVAATGLIDMPSTGDVAAIGIQSNTPSNNNKGDTVATNNQADAVVIGDQVVAPVIDIQSGFDVVEELEGVGIPPAHDTDTTGSNTNTKTADTDIIKDTEALFPGPYVTLEEANSDNEKLYLDPAICKKCNPDITVRNSCFLKHPLDCRKYIHCIFPNEKWIAYNMRCGFGTFWSYEHNTCQFSHMVDCTTDLCRNPTLKSYDNALNDNCRAYWSCEKGHSVPVCCDKYFSYRSGQCVPDNNCTNECPDPCQNTDITSYANDINCRNFYECKNKKSKSFCCAAGQAYINGTCMDDSVCDLPCPADAILLERKEITATTDKPTTKRSCSLEAVGRKTFQFIGNTNKLHIMTCPGNLVFRIEKCTCDHPSSDISDTLPRECKPEVCVNFESDLHSFKVENHHKVNISGGRGHFNGESYLAIPVYSFNERFSKNTNIKMLFKSKPGIGQDRQVLVSNCRTVISAGSSRLSPSLAILIDKSLEQHFVIYLGTTKDNGNASIAHTFQPNQWTSLELLFDGHRLSATTSSIDYDTGRSIDSQFDTKELTGELKVGLESLKIGKCLLRDGFHGEMDDVCIGDCVNGKFFGSPPV